MNEHIGSNFDDFLKEENIEIKKEEIRKRLDDMLKKDCIEFLGKKLEPDSENAQRFFNGLNDYFKGLVKQKLVMPDYEIKKPKLPRKLKKKYKKERILSFDLYFRKPDRVEFTIPIDKEIAEALKGELTNETN